MRTKQKRSLAVALALLLLLGTLLLPLSAYADPKATAPAFLPGDVNLDGSITSADARLALRAAVGLEDYDPCSCQAAAADVDANNAYSAGDARLILRAAVGLENLPAGIRVSCDRFTVTLPSYWAGKYAAETTEDSIRFYYKSAKNAGLNGFLFSIYEVPLREAQEYADFGSLALLLEGTDPENCIMIGYPSDYQADPADADEYYRMNGNAQAIAGTLEPAAWYVYPTVPDYSNFSTLYYGSAFGDLSYTLRIREIRRNIIEAAVSYESLSGEDYEEAEVFFTMYGDKGLVTWNDGYEFHMGSVQMAGVSLEVTLNGAPGSWADTYGPITFYPQREMPDPAYFDDHALTEAQSSQILERLRGVWMNQNEDYMIWFLQEGGDADHDPGWTLATGPKSAGVDYSGAIETPLAGDPNGVVRLHTVRPSYTDTDGEYYPAVELNFYVDLKMINDNSISWTAMGEDWETCSFYAIHPSLIWEEDAYNELLSQDEVSDLMDSLRGVWMNFDRTYFLAFCQIDRLNWEASIGAPYSEYDFVGVVSREVYRNAEGELRTTVSGTDMNGDRYTIYLYLDVSRKMDNSIFWSTDGYEWESCDLFCMGVEQIPDRLG